MDDEEKTRMLRDKETADDYRYFPEPDIPPLHFEAKDLEKIKAALPKLPKELRDHYLALGLDSKQAMQVIDDAALRSMFDAVYAKTKDGKRTVSLVLTQLLGFLNAANTSVSQGPTMSAMLELIEAIDAGTISGNAGKDVMEKMVATGKSAKDIIAAEGMQQISDDSAIEELVKKAIAANPKAIESWKAGKEAALGAIVGWVMKESKGQANPGKVQAILRKHL